MSFLESSDETVAVPLPSDIVMGEYIRPVMITIHFEKTSSINDGNWCNDINVKADMIDE
jgi:hypothetical protein